MKQQVALHTLPVPERDGGGMTFRHGWSLPCPSFSLQPADPSALLHCRPQRLRSGKSDRGTLCVPVVVGQRTQFHFFAAVVPRKANGLAYVGTIADTENVPRA